MQSNSMDSSNGIIDEAFGHLPSGWKVVPAPESAQPPFDGAFDLHSPSGAASRFVFQTKKRFEPRDVDRVVRTFSGLPSGAHPLLLASFLSLRSREVLRGHGVSHADATGTLWISTATIYVERTGETRVSATKDGPPRRSLRGPITGRVVRYLCDVSAPLKVREIAQGTNVHPGNVSRILDLLERDLLVRRSRGAVEEVEWKDLIRRWGPDLAKDRKMETCLAPRGVDDELARLRNADLPYALTGSYASASLAPAVIPASLDIYVKSVREARAALALHEAEGVGNVRLIEAFDRVAFERTIVWDDLILASPSQIAADLVTLPRRSADELNELFSWMERNAADWRR
ncbi:MAG: hypothetical protein JOZ86_16640 [Candidatus Eremiobacteraeota bacterium]|nr:hypothetical protein [Candidatus Eremiobacteraeota bacterium]